MEKVGNNKEYVIALASLPEGRYVRDFDCGTGFFRAMGNDTVSASDVTVHLTLDRHGDQYRCRFEFRGSVDVPCDRCLEPMRLPMNEDYGITVRYGDDYDDSRDNLLVLSWSMSEWDVASMLRDTILLEIPLRHVHSEGGCDAVMAALLEEMSSSEETPEEE